MCMYVRVYIYIYIAYVATYCFSQTHAIYKIRAAKQNTTTYSNVNTNDTKHNES